MSKATQEISTWTVPRIIPRQDCHDCIVIRHLYAPSASKLPLRPHTLSTNLICQPKPNGSSEFVGWGAAALSKGRLQLSRCSGFQLTRLAYVVCGGFHGKKKIKRIEKTKKKLRKRSLLSPKNAGHVVFCWSQMAPDAWADPKNLIDLASYSVSEGNILLYVYNVYITYVLICAQLYIYIYVNVYACFEGFNETFICMHNLMIHFYVYKSYALALV